MRANAISARDAGILIDIEFGDRDLALQLFGDFFERRADHLAGTAPFGPEIDDDGTGGADHIGLEIGIGDFDCRHGASLENGRAGSPGAFHPESKKPGQRRQGALSATSPAGPAAGPADTASIAASASSRRASSSVTTEGSAVQTSSMRTRLPGHSGASAAR